MTWKKEERERLRERETEEYDGVRERGIGETDASLSSVMGKMWRTGGIVFFIFHLPTSAAWSDNFPLDRLPLGQFTPPGQFSLKQISPLDNSHMENSFMERVRVKFRQVGIVQGELNCPSWKLSEGAGKLSVENCLREVVQEPSAQLHYPYTMPRGLATFHTTQTDIWL